LTISSTLSRLDLRASCAAAEADVAYRLAYAKALLRAEGGTVAEREAAAILAWADLLRERRISMSLPRRVLDPGTLR
jgi:hypothetical protein